jgi:MraZ protein
VGVSGKKWEIVERRHSFARRSAYIGLVEQMFLGRYEHSIDEKGRLTIPVRYRELLADGAYVTQGIDHNLIVHPAASFEILSAKVNQLAFTDPAARQLKRFMFSNAEFCEIDKAGRILIPPFLRDSAGLNGAVTVVGAGEYFEIWAPDSWKQQYEILQDADATAERFASLNLTQQ